MKNLSSSYHLTPQGYQLKPQDYVLELDADNSALALAQGLYHQVDDWVALELTAEQMLSDEMQFVGRYIASDAVQIWAAIRDNLLPYELVFEDMLKQAAGEPIRPDV